MAIRYKGNILSRLKDRGYSTARLRKEKLLGESTIQAFRTNTDERSYKTLNTLCQLLGCQVGDIIEYVPDPPDSPAPGSADE